MVGSGTVMSVLIDQFTDSTAVISDATVAGRLRGHYPEDLPVTASPPVHL
jgi:hypothetical protein